ncbi:hypothetical protein PFMALIP_00640, partial [Plasmodium falciparum MaliPS096_E11]
MCTSNLENLSTSSKGLSGDSVNDSFLGHVMLSANFEADFIKKKYKEGKNPEGFKNNATICQAIRYSFADLGDIIRGKDMWNINSDAKDLQSNLKTVFGKIKSTLNGKYNDDTLDYKQLRSDWWEANRHQVWRAMKCAMKNGNIDKCNGIPIEDYIPQRLRWMTEWAEWYCKKQSQEYEKLEEKCGMCTGKGKDQKCWKDDSECKKCRAARDAYKKEIEKWEKQWKTVSAIYQILYAKARIVASNGGPGYYNTEVQKKDRSVYDFLYELHLQNGGKKGPPPDTHPSKYVAPRVKRASPVNITPTVDTTPTVYSTAAGYVHQEAHIGDCKEQTQFCKNTIGSEVSDTEADPTYAFRHQPHDYDVELRCEDRRTLKPPPPPAPPPTTPSTPNPCGGGRDQNDNNIVSVKDVAQGMQRAVQTQLDGDKGESVLKGDIKNAKFKKNLKGSELKGQICDLDEHKHTNAESRRGYDYKGPCTGKNQGRFEIGKEWKHGSEIQFPINDYMPPRRQHMCTSNLENLHLSKEGLSDGTLASHSLLGDILLAAKYEGQNIMNLYLQNNSKTRLTEENDRATVCRAMKYSFADIGDIIRGKDMWIENNDAKRLQTNLKEIFTKIKEKTGGTTYNEDNDPYLKLRADWWEANRDKIWEAMKCATKNGSNIKCGDNPPFDDYVPQRLRWMTEWSEWYCKIQKKEYDTLQNACRECRSKGGKCMNGDNNCETCTQACKEYAKNIKPWEKQWDKIKEKYKTLYDKAKNDDTSSTEGSKDEKDVVDFLKKLYQQNKENNNIYSTAARYIHQEAKYLDCKTQTEFCEKENGDNSTSAGKENEKYAFKKPPPEYQQACNCNENVTPRPPALSNVCNTVKEHIGKNNGTQEIDNCKPKTEGTYPKWKCGDADLVTDDNVCMPPRRQKLCIIKLQYLGGTSKNDLREAFIKCAAAETFLLWHKYKEDKQKEFPSKTLHEVVQNQLNGGIIPEEFKRQMFYTFGDFRDMCLGTDISKKGDVTRGVGKVEKNIDDVFLEDGQKNDKTERKNWWDRIKENVWEGMLCGLSHHIKNGKKEELTIKTEYNYETVTFDGTTKLEEFAKRPQFLRWFTEWGEEFCKKRKEQVDILKGKCPDDTCRKGDDVKQKCTKACAEYTSWLTKWKENYQKQSQKYTDDKGQQLYKNIDDVTNSDHAYEYLGKKLTNITCSNGSTNENCVYKCMDNKSEESSMPASLDKEPQEVKGKCSCTPPPTKPEVPPAKVPSACEIVKGILTGKNENHFIGNCKRKDYQGKAYPGWNCDTEIHTKHIGACMPPRRQKLCIHFLAHPSEITKIDTQDILREAFIKSAAAETFFSWIYYKKTSSKGNDLDNTLKGGTIPPEYLRLMFYTFGDYRDFLFGTDISKNHGKESKLKEQIDTLFPTDGRTQNGLSREAWWQNYGSHIWKAMLCALEKIAGNKDKLTGHQSKYQYNSVKFSDNRNGPDLETFAKRPQFLRWFTEWGEHFCREQKKQLDILKKKCPKETCTNEGKKKECSDACKAYKEWLQ